MTTVKFSTEKFDTLILIPTIGIDKFISSTEIRFAFLYSVFNIEISKKCD